MKVLSRHAVTIGVWAVLGAFGSMLTFAEWPVAALFGMALGTDYGQRAWRGHGNLPAILLGITLGSIPLWVPIGMTVSGRDLLSSLLFPCLPAIMIVFGLTLQLSLMKAYKLRVRAMERKRAA